MEVQSENAPRISPVVNRYKRQKNITRHWNGNKPKMMLNDGMRPWTDQHYFRSNWIPFRNFGLKPGCFRYYLTISADPVRKGVTVAHSECNHSKSSRYYIIRNKPYTDQYGRLPQGKPRKNIIW